MRTAILPIVVVAIASVFFYERPFQSGVENPATPESTQAIAIPAILLKTTFSSPVPEGTLHPKTSGTPTPAPSPWTPNPLQDYQGLVDFCEQNASATGARALEGLNQVTFPSDVPKPIQDELPAKIDIWPSCNFETSNRPRAIVLHYTEGSLGATISTFQQPHESSAHYVIDRDGRVYQLVPERFAAFHVTCYGVRSKCAPSCPVCLGPNGKFLDPIYQTVGIELVNLGHVDPRYYQGDIYEDYSDSFGYRYWQDYPPEQIHSLQMLVNDVRARWGIPIDMVIGHYRINNNTDPGPALNLFWFRNGNPSRPAIFSPDETLTPWDSPS
jgi:hypothetical protein